MTILGMQTKTPRNLGFKLYWTDCAFFSFKYRSGHGTLLLSTSARAPAGYEPPSAGIYVWSRSVSTVLIQTNKNLSVSDR